MEQVTPGASAGPAFESAKRLFFEGLAALQGGPSRGRRARLRRFARSRAGTGLDPAQPRHDAPPDAPAARGDRRRRRGARQPSRTTSTPSASAPSPWPAWACRSRRSPPTTGWSRPIRTWPRCGASAAACCARWAGSKRPRRPTREARDTGRRPGAQRLLPRRRLRRHAAPCRAARLRRRPVRRLLGRVRRPSRRRPRLSRATTCSSRTCPSRGRRFASVLDLGCGTGLCGPLLKPRPERLTGIDLAAGMLERARAHGVYDRLERAEVVAWLEANRETFDLIVSVDVLIYIGDLERLFAGARRALASGGAVRLQHRALAGAATTGRRSPCSRAFATPTPPATSASWPRGMASTVVRSVQATLREDRREAVEGIYFYLTTA